MQQFARAEFEQHRQVTDLVRPLAGPPLRPQLMRLFKGHIRYLISSGKTQYDTMKSSLINSGILIA
jgi:hypothetical protein